MSMPPSMAAHVPMDQPCGECEYCSWPNWELERHPTTFKVVSNSHVDGINFKSGHFTTNQIADAFANLIPGHMDWKIKTSAVERWNALLPLLLEEPNLREGEFDIQPLYRLLDDFLFLRALQDICVVEWVDERLRVQGRPKSGWVLQETNIRGPRFRICMSRPSPEKPRTVHNVLCVLMHEMCHALLYLACACSVCSCELNNMNGWGITGHGPAWRRVGAAAQETANLSLKGFAEPFLLAHRREPDVRLEAEARVKLLEGIYKKVSKESNPVEREKKIQRSEKRAAKRTNSPENDEKKANSDEALACVCAMFEEWEKVASTFSEGQSGAGGRLAEGMANEEAKADDDQFGEGKNEYGGKEKDLG